MAIRVVMAGATGWVGRAMIPAIAAQRDMALAGAVARNAAGQDSGGALGLAPNGVTVSGTLEEALAAPSDVVVDYTKPDVVKANTLVAIARGRHVVIGASGLGAADYDEIDRAARAAGVGVLAAGNFSITATLMKRFALMAAKYVPDVEIVDYASAKKADAPSGTARELAEALADVRGASTARPVGEVLGVPGTRGAAVGAGKACRCIHSGCRPISFPARRCSAYQKNGCRSATTPDRRRLPMWRARCSPSGASRSSRGW